MDKHIENKKIKESMSDVSTSNESDHEDAPRKKTKLIKKFKNNPFFYSDDDDYVY